MKFFKLLKKEIVELLTAQTIIGVFVSLLIFVLLGNVMGGVGEKLNKSGSSVVIADYDNSATSAQIKEQLKADNFNIIEAPLFEADNGTDQALLNFAAESDHTSLLKIPKGFEAGLNAEKSQKITILSELKSFSIMSNMDNSASDAANAINAFLTSKLLKEKAPNIDVQYLDNPVITEEITMSKGNSAPVNSAMLASIAMQQSVFIPVIVFLLITFATQLNISAIANEKSDKTLETLLSAPVSRLAVLGAKMTASATFSLLMAGVFMFGFSTYMGGMTESMAGGANVSGGANVLQSLGLQLNPLQYVAIGIQLFLTICIALVISLILGAMAKDLKSAQGLITPLMFAAMIPYFITMFMDVNALPTALRFLIYAIPFTHTFTASANLLFGNNMLFIFGTLYQLLFLCGALFLAVKLFSSDKIFTMTLTLSKKKKKVVTE